MTSEWPVFVYLGESLDEPYAANDAGTYYRDSSGERVRGPVWELDCDVFDPVYIHRDAARAWQAFRDFLNGVDDGEMVDWRHALRECRINSYREGAEHANLAWTTGVRKR